MIRKINYVRNLSVFKDFIWDNEVKDKDNNVKYFKAINIFYGRNYTGKTSLSRIFKSCKDKQLYEKIKDAEFELLCEIGEQETIQISNNNLDDCPYNVKVYNSDFVETHLQWLTNEDSGDIKPFAIIGGENIKIEEEIEALNECLGSEINKKGLLYELANEKAKHEEKHKEYERRKTALDNLLINEAVNIKEAGIYKEYSYNITKINNDIKLLKAAAQELLSDEDVQMYKQYLKQEYKNKIQTLEIDFTDTLELAGKANLLIEKKVSPSQIIKELLEDNHLREWVREGMSLHKAKNKCAFCGGVLSDELWEKLDSHFTKESENLRNDIIELKEQIDLNIKLSSFPIPNTSNDFYATYSKDADEAIKKINESKINHLNILYTISNRLNQKKNDIFSYTDSLDMSQMTSTLRNILDQYNELVINNNKESLELSEKQKKYREKLRFDTVSKFILKIGYDSKLEEIRVLKKARNKLNEDVEKIEDNINKTNEKLESLRSKLVDESRGAEKINEYLSNSFGHNAISLEAYEDDESGRHKYDIKRGNEIAYNLSEGEKSIVSFCYFMAKLSEADTDDRDTIVWIDDPVSSLDCNHIFFVFSLIKNLLAAPITDSKKVSKFKQLFITTHDLEFLKYLKRLSRDSKHQYFLIHKSGDESTINVMPLYLKEYVTEFNYLFHQIYKCAKKDFPTDNPEYYYDFGNNLRKFLDIYLFFQISLLL